MILIHLIDSVYELFFHFSQRIALKFTLDLNTFIPVNDVVRTEIKKNLQQKIYNVLGEKLENKIRDVNFNQVK
jgi:hypothetical protein